MAFLKTIRARTDPERRARFFREANAYDTFRVAGVPDLIESNAHQHKDASFEPYIATRFIEGPTLRQWHDAQGCVDLKAAVTTTRSLLLVLNECHLAGCVHRDVKPDNIILSKGDPSKVTLLDFGLNFHNVPGLDFQTEHWQEVGNRLLRLPELSAGSILKQDPRSDLSFAAGILFYLLTGEHPDVVQDAEGRLPHQRSRPLAKLQEIAGVRFLHLAALFDTAFAPQIAHRFSNVGAMLESVDRMITNREIGQSAEDDLAAILEVVNTEAERRRVETTKRLTDALRRVDSVYREAERSFGGALVLSQTGFGVTGEVGRNTLFWCRPGSSDQVLSTTYEARETGDEIVICMSGETVFRTLAADPKYDDEFQSSVHKWLLARLRAAVSDPDALPPEADNFREVRPVAHLDDAADEACRTGRRILAFVYDQSEGERGQLQWRLSYFLQNRRTRDTIASAFVIALIPISQVRAKSHVLDDLSEGSRWIVFDADFNALEQAVIYPNAQEGERIALDLAGRFAA